MFVAHYLKPTEFDDMTHCKTISSVAVFIALSSCSEADLRETAQRSLLSSPISDNAVLQHGINIPLKGETTANTLVSVAFNDIRIETTSNDTGHWVATLPSQEAKSSGTLEITSESGSSTKLSNIVFGDIWLCSGQSNMDMSVRIAANSDRVISRASNKSIRIAKVSRHASPKPINDVFWQIPWSEASPETIADFSSACWHMGQDLSKALGIPIGLIQSSWGGSSLQDWSPQKTLEKVGTFEAAQKLLGRYADNPQRTMQDALMSTNAWANKTDPGSLKDSPWWTTDLNTTDWKSIDFPGAWEKSGIPALRNFDGVIWFRKSITLTKDDILGNATLDLGKVDERDSTWINGVYLGSTIGSQKDRIYDIPDNVLREGENIIAIRIIDEQGSGGIRTQDAPLSIETASGQSIKLAGPWLYKTGISRIDWDTPPPFIPWAAPRGISTLYNGMIHPLTELPIAGVAWYQGESNTRVEKLSAKILPAWREDWRSAFGADDLPFIIVQLPDYGAHRTKPSNSAWPKFREVQRKFANSDTNTGLAVTIDLGVVEDIHPTHKLRVGQRMAKEALRVAYDKDISAAPQPLSATYSDGIVSITFDESTDPLQVIGGHAPIGFEVCFPDTGCKFTSSSVDKDKVLINVTGPHPSEIRYAWQPSPIVNLYSESGLPVTPFRITVSTAHN